MYVQPTIFALPWFASAWALKAITPRARRHKPPGTRTKPMVAYFTTPRSSASSSICGRLPNRAQMELKANGDGQS
eukprot:scaffold58283_cov41-Phaeocystis_antarctica.AAC.2